MGPALLVVPSHSQTQRSGQSGEEDIGFRTAGFKMGAAPRHLARNKGEPGGKAGENENIPWGRVA